ncbi:hypothetical protein ESB00_01435 [Oleiharenicola lentus]|uniref:Tetratricopeptide repeat protein n=1 Tax=Oleiharenicola lentus TaxID=2508720 RepID=A0A4Q1C715_9BACT|nr:hypothetical protein [Oleiharenicola lentus]RXK54591.1 hypothetical protein ESB00_01435 [Oleiharenicola lentus]
MRHFFLLLLLLSLGILPALSADPVPGTPPAPWFDRVQNAVALGEREELAELLKGEIPPVPAGVTPYDYQTRLALAALDAGDTAATIRFMEQADEHAPVEGNLVWIAGVAWLFQGERDQALRLVKGYQRRDIDHPAAHYLLALDAFIQWRQLGPLHPDAEKLFATARREIEAATNRAAQGRPGYHRRFLVLACSIGEFYDGEDEYRAAVIQRHLEHQRNRPFLRALFAFGAPRDEHTLLRDTQHARLSDDEIAVWRRASELPSVGSDSSPSNVAAHLAVLPDRPEFDEARLIILRQGLLASRRRLAEWRKQFAADGGPGLSPEGRAALAEISDGLGDNYPERLQTYARLAVKFGKTGDAYHALRLIDAVRALDETQRIADAELEIPLAKLAGDPRRALPLVLAQAPAHAQDEAWLRINGALVQHFAELPVALAYITHLARMAPDDLRIQFSLASLADRPVSEEQRRADHAYLAKITRARVGYTPEQLAADPDNVLNSDRERLNLYAQLFARVPADHVPEARHWQAYEALLERNVFQEAFLDGLTEAEVKGRTFRALVERCRREAPQNRVIAAQQGRLLACDATVLAQQAEKAPAAEAPALWEKVGATVKTAAEAGATPAQLEPARQLISNHERAQRLARERQAAAEADAKARRIAEERIFARQRRESELADQARERIRYLQSLGVARDEIVREGSAARRPYYTTRQAANAANAASLSKVLESLCETCNGLGLNSAGKGMVRACTFCGGSGLQYWAKQKGMPGARFEGVDPFPFDL